MAKQKKPTVKVRIRVPVAGVDFSWYPGQVVDMPEAEAAKWADGERGEYVTPPTSPRQDTDSTPTKPVDEQPGDSGTEPPGTADADLASLDPSPAAAAGEQPGDSGIEPPRQADPDSASPDAAAGDGEEHATGEQDGADTEPAADDQSDTAGGPEGAAGEQTEEAEVRTEQREPAGDEQPVRGGQTVETTESAKRPARGRRGTGRGKAGSVETT